jgi:hypothetical protein
MRKILLVLGAAALVSTSPALAKKKPEISGLELQQIQARDFEAAKEVTFPAVMTVLQDSGYRIAAADKETGLITGSASTKSNTTWVPFIGFGKSKKTPVVSAFIEDRGAGSRIRLNFVMAKTKSGMYGMNSSDEEPITDALAYKNAFEKIEKEIFIRQSLNAPKPVVPVAAVTPASAVTNAVVEAAAPAAAAAPTAMDLGGGVRLMPARTPSGYCIQAPSGYVGTGSATRPAVSTERPLCS